MNALIIEDHEFLTVAEVAALLQCSEPTVRRRIREGQLPAVKLGRGRSVLRVPRAVLAGVAGDEYPVDRDVDQFICSRRTGSSAVTADIAFRVVLAVPFASRRWAGGHGAVPPAPAIAHRQPTRSEDPVRRETADPLRRLGAPKDIRTRLSELPPGKALGSRLVNGERVWRVVPATQSQPSANPELEAARRRARRAVASARRDRRRHLLAHTRRAIREQRRRA